MMPKAHTLLPPALDPADAATGDPALDTFSLEGVGVHAVLGAMIEQRRASQVAAEELGEDEFDAPPSEGAPRTRPKRDPATSDVFLKAR